MKKIISLFLAVSLIGNVVALDLSQCQQKTFTITGYYSPKPDQDRYYRGTYEKEVYLNGNGTHGASGKPVFNGMIAAPKTYSFGTKIYLNGFGLGEVADRGGAIVSSGNRGYSSDRLDVWMGEGQVGLQKALALGKRVVTGYICDEVDSKVGFDHSKVAGLSAYKSVVAPKKSTTSIASTTTTKTQKTILASSVQSPKIAQPIFDTAFDIGDKSDKVVKLQNALTELGYYASKPTGIYDQTTAEAVYKFQLDNNLVKKGDKVGGYFGTKTRQTLETKYIEFQKSIKLQNTSNKEVGNIGKITDKTSIKTLAKPFSKTFKSGEKSEEIKRLQNALNLLGFYKGKITGIYDQTTIDAIAQFQIKNFLVDKNDKKNKGTFGLKTREIFNLTLSQINANMKK